tara:strand:- start:574 stop:801 length:228 start_codon:yes stop_codon:yes gene_type:complete
MNNVLIYISLSAVILLLIIIRLINKQVDNQKQIIKLLSTLSSEKNSSEKARKGPMSSEELESIKAEVLKSGGYKP